MNNLTETLNYNDTIIKYNYNPNDKSGYWCIEEIVVNDEYELYKYKNSKNVLIDIGGNHGLVTCILAKQNPDAKIIILEPIPRLVDIIKKNIKLNNLTNVIIVDKALGDGNNINLCVPIKGCSGASSTLVNDVKDFSERYEGVEEIIVKTISFDNLLKKYGVDNKIIDLLKIDCEGGEYYLYDSEILKNNIIKNITGEFHNLKYNQKINSNWNSEDLTNYLKKYISGNFKITYLNI